MLIKKTKNIEINKTIKLLCPIEEANSKLRERIIKGQEIINIQISSQQDLDNANEKYINWNVYNKDLINGLFSTDKLTKEYNFEPLIPIYGRDLIFKDKVLEFHKELNEKINRIESIIERLELYL